MWLVAASDPALSADSGPPSVVPQVDASWRATFALSASSSLYDMYHALFCQDFASQGAGQQNTQIDDSLGLVTGIMLCGLRSFREGIKIA